ncbi:MAG: DeoR family transcriptional regulator [Candidatus Spechtbacterales bacterium]
MLYQSLIIFIGVVVGFVVATVIYGGFKYRNITDEEGNKPGFLRRGIVGRRQEKKKHNVQKLKEYINDKKEVTNNEVEKLLNVSDSTATRYLNELKDEGVIEQVGDTGRGTYYRKINGSLQ